MIMLLRWNNGMECCPVAPGCAFLEELHCLWAAEATGVSALERCSANRESDTKHCTVKRMRRLSSFSWQFIYK